MNIGVRLKPLDISIFSINISRQISSMHRSIINCNFSSFLGNRCLVQAGRTVGEWKERNNVFSSIPNYIYMSHDIQLFPIGYPGKLFFMQFGLFSHVITCNIYWIHRIIFQTYPIYHHNFIPGVQISSRVLLLQHGKNDISCLPVRIRAYIKVSTASKLEKHILIRRNRVFRRLIFHILES